jgi:hypothetical protein
LAVGGTSGQPAVASVPPALAVATPVLGSISDLTSGLTSAFCAKTGAAATISTMAIIAANIINFFNFFYLLTSGVYYHLLLYQLLVVSSSKLRTL